MILSYFESLKYVGHLWPISFLRWFVGFQYLRMGLQHVRSGFVDHPSISEQLRLKMESMDVISSYFSFCTSIIQSNWLIASYIIVGTEFLIAVSYFLGYLVRPVAFWAAFLSLHLFWLLEVQSDQTQLIYGSVHVCLCLVGAGRCLGLDYYFYKTRRGLIW